MQLVEMEILEFEKRDRRLDKLKNKEFITLKIIDLEATLTEKISVERIKRFHIGEMSRNQVVEDYKVRWR